MAGQKESVHHQAGREPSCVFLVRNALTGRLSTLPSAVTGPKPVRSRASLHPVRLGWPPSSLLRFHLLLCLLALLAPSLPLTVAAPFSVLDSYAPSCALPTSKTINGELAGR